MKSVIAILFLAALCVRADQQVIFLGTTNGDGTGDNAPVAGAKINQNFADLYNRAFIASNTISGVSNANVTVSNATVTLGGQVLGISNMVVASSNLFAAIDTQHFARNKLIILEGSSTMAGNVSTNPFEWQLRAALAPSGWTIVNQAVAGDTTAGMMSRLYTQTIPRHPAIVLMGMGGNELMGGNETPVNYNNWISNTLVYATILEQNGITPIITSQWPAGNEAQWMSPYRTMYKNVIEQSGYPIIDFQSDNDIRDGTGNAYALFAYGDGLHFNNLGHSNLFESVPLDIFNHPQKQAPIRAQSGGATVVGTLATNSAFSYGFYRNPPHSYTIAFWARLDAYVPAFTRLISIGDTNAWPDAGQDVRLRGDAGALSFVTPARLGGATIAISNAFPWELKWNHYALVHNDYYNGGTNWIYVNGVQQGSCAGNLDYNTLFFEFGGSRWGANSVPKVDYRDIAIYRTSLLDDEIKQLYLGNVPRAGLEVFAPLTEQTYTWGQVLVNKAPTDTGLLCNTNSVEVSPMLSPGGVPYTVTPTGSPFNVTNTSGQDYTLYISKGTLSSILVNGVETGGMTNSANLYVLKPQDVLSATYTVAPVITSK